MFKPHLLVIGGTGFIGYHLTLAAIKKGWKVTSVSLNKPKKFRFVEGVKYLKINISNLLDININNISIKATTNEKIGFIGKREGIAAESIIQIKNE